MKIVFYGTRGSIPIAREDSVDHGGNTTCVRIISSCIPLKTALVVDAGSGYVECSKALLKEGIMNISSLFTHWHYDHTLGLTLAPHTFIPTAHMKAWGPKEHNVGVKKVFSTLLRAPFFPVDFQLLLHRFECHNLEFIGTQVFIVHPEAGFFLFPVHALEKAEKEGRQIHMGKAGYFSIDECLIVKMYKAKHPEYTISYRFEERPTGKIFCFLTDHENTDQLSWELQKHIQGADVLVQDCQYSREQYNKKTAGFGHGTPDYCVDTAICSNAKKLGLTHHDPGASDLDVQARCEEAISHCPQGSMLEIFACYDFQELEI